MSKQMSPPHWAVYINGVLFRRGFVGERGKREAEAMAERWQGSHSGNKGLLKHKDRGDYVEVRRDYKMEEEFNTRIDEATQGNAQKYVVEYDTLYS